MNFKDILKNNVSTGLGFGVGVGISYIYDWWQTRQVVVVPAESEERQLEVIEEREERRGVVIDAEAWRQQKPDPVDPALQALLDEEAETERQSLITLQDQVTQSYQTNIFAGADGDWDYESELNTRNPLNPYVLHRDEFMGDEMDYRQETMTYYAGDGVMVDAQDNPIYNFPELMGELKFGHGSNDPNVVYIRNEGIHIEWEVLLSQGLYSIEVMGLAAEEEVEHELRHSGPLKFRRD